MNSYLVRVAQALSATLEVAISDATNETFLPDAELDEECGEFLEAVGAELIHDALADRGCRNAEAFEIRTGDGRVFQVSLHEVTGRQQTTIL